MKKQQQHTYRRSAERCTICSRWAWVRICLAVVVVATSARALVVPPPQQPIFDKDVPPRLPDLDQNRDYTGDQIPETTWCAPTAAANSVWYFGNSGYPELIPAGANNIAKADALITSLGGLMNTADPNGTTIANAVNGLQQYFNINTTTPFTVTFATAWSFPDNFGNPSAQNLWNWMTSELEKCEDVLPVIWLAGPNGQAPNDPTNPGQIGETDLDSALGHLVTMTAYNWSQPGTIDIHDPDDAPLGTGHVFPPVPAGPPGKVTYNVALIGNTALLLNNINGALNNSLIVGAISASPVPEPATLALLALGGVMAIRRRR